MISREQAEIFVIQSEQGWSDRTLGDMVLNFVLNNGCWEEFLTVLKNIQAEENNYDDDF